MGWTIINHANIGVIEIETEDDVFDLAKFKPSTDINDAWGVINKFKESRFSVRKGFISELHQVVTPVELKASGNLLHESELIYHLTPLAICIAALRVIGIEVGHN